MTDCGTLMAITRHGINPGALMRSSFEQTAEVIKEAAAVREREMIATESRRTSSLVRWDLWTRDHSTLR